MAATQAEWGVPDAVAGVAAPSSTSRSKQATVVADEVRRLRSAACSRETIHLGIHGYISIAEATPGLLGQKPDQDQKIASKLAPTGPQESITYFVFDESERVRDLLNINRSRASSLLQGRVVRADPLRLQKQLRVMASHLAVIQHTQ